MRYSKVLKHIRLYCMLKHVSFYCMLYTVSFYCMLYTDMVLFLGLVLPLYFFTQKGYGEKEICHMT